MAGGDKEHRGGGGRDAFLHSLDRVPSGLHIDADFPSDDDDDDEEEVRVSFASAMGDHKMHSFRRHQAAVLEEEEEEEDDLSKYDMWMSDEHMTIQERRRRLHQGLGLASSRDLALRRHSTRKRMVDIPRSVSKMPPLPSPAATSAGPTTAAAAPAPRPSARDMLMQRPAKPITRRRSDGFLATRDGGVSAGGSGKPPPPSPSVRRVRSLPARHAGCDDISLVEKFRNAVAKRDLPAAVPPPAASAATVPVVKGRTGDGGSGGKDRDDAAKNQESSKEVAVVPTSKDAGASNTQTGVQLGLEEIEKFIGNTPIVKHLMRRGQSQHHSGQLASPSGGAPPKAEKPAGGKKKGGWLKNIKSVAIGFIQDKDSSSSSKSTPSTTTSSAAYATSSSSSSTASSSERLKVHQSGKSCKELTGLYMCQEIMAHEGSIWSIKFSTDGRWLASAGEDHVVRIWQVVEASSPACTLPNDGNSGPLPPQPPGATAADGTSSTTTPALSQLSKKSVKGKSGRDTLPEHLVVPDKVFALADQPACVLEGHQDDVLDLTWSKSDQLLSSSMDKTVRLWDTTTKACLKVFAHNDYVTCIQFNPVDDRYFISGSLDAKVRLWSIPDRQVVDWTDLNEMVTAASYTPDGQGAIIGSHKGSCRFYKTTDCKLNQEAQIDIQTKKRKSQAKKITGFQFAPGNPSEVLVTSADSQIRVFDGVTMVQKFRGFKNTSSQISAAYTSDGRYVVCASEDSHVYLWRAARGAPPAAAAIGGIGMKPKTWCTIRSFENFYCKDVSAAVPWPLAPSAGGGGDGSTSGSSPSRRQGVSCTDDVCSMPAKSGELGNAGTPLTHSGQLGSAPGGGKGGGGADGNAWGLVVVTASLHGEIRVYQNFGMPFRIRGQGNLFY